MQWAAYITALPVIFSAVTVFRIPFSNTPLILTDLSSGFVVGVAVGSSVGFIVGVAVGSSVGFVVGVAVGYSVGFTVGDGDCDGDATPSPIISRSLI